MRHSFNTHLWFILTENDAESGPISDTTNNKRNFKFVKHIWKQLIDDAMDIECQFNENVSKSMVLGDYHALLTELAWIVFKIKLYRNRNW